MSRALWTRRGGAVAAPQGAPRRHPPGFLMDDKPDRSRRLLEQVFGSNAGIELRTIAGGGGGLLRRHHGRVVRERRARRGLARLRRRADAAQVTPAVLMPTADELEEGSVLFVRALEHTLTERRSLLSRSVTLDRLGCFGSGYWRTSGTTSKPSPPETAQPSAHRATVRALALWLVARLESVIAGRHPERGLLPRSLPRAGYSRRARCGVGVTMIARSGGSPTGHSATSSSRCARASRTSASTRPPSSRCCAAVPSGGVLADRQLVAARGAACNRSPAWSLRRCQTS